jgi:hypothetical protein
VIYKFKISNNAGVSIDLCNTKLCYLYKCSGLNPVAADIVQINKHGNGSLITSKNIHYRNILLQIRMRKPVEENRRKLYELLLPQMSVNIEIKTENKLPFFITGIVESFENNYFEKGQSPQISIICENPFFTSGEKETYLMNCTYGNDSFATETLTFKNKGNVNASGFKISLTATSSVLGSPEIKNKNTGQQIKFAKTEIFDNFFSADYSAKLTVDIDNKTCELLYKSSGNYYTANVTNYISTYSEFPDLLPGDNNFEISFYRSIKAQMEYIPTFNGI